MKDGTAGDPFADDAEPETIEEQDTSVVDSGNDGPGYAVERSGVKDGREMTPLYLQDETEERAAEVKSEVEGILGYDVYMTDFKEAAYLEGLSSPEGIASRLDSWGCEYA